MKDLNSLKKTIDELGEALTILKRNEKLLPDEYKFLLDPNFKDQLERAKGQAERILLSAQRMGDEGGPENVDNARIKEIVQYLQERNLLDGPEASEEEVKPGGEGAKDPNPKESATDSKKDGSKVRGESTEDDPEEKNVRFKKRAMRVIERLLDADLDDE